MEAYSDLAMSLLQARLIELRQPVWLGMNIKIAETDERIHHESMPADDLENIRLARRQVGDGRGVDEDAHS